MPTSRMTRAGRALSPAERSVQTDRLVWLALRAPDATARALAQDEVVALNIRVALAIAARYRGRGVPLEDLEQVACEGLVKAVQRFDPRLQHDLLSYAVPTIRGELLRHLRDLGSLVRPPRRLQELQRSIAAASETLRRDLGRDPTPEEVCRALDIEPSEHEAARAASLACRTASLDLPVGDGTNGLGELIADGREDLAPAEARAMLEPVLRALDESDRELVRLRFVDDLSQREIGEAMGVTQVQVSRRLSRICATLRTRLGNPSAA